jgi:tetratricopeptide (TPR) repeat protein
MLVASAAVTLVATSAGAQPSQRHRLDEQELSNERVLRPAVAELIEQGEAALRGRELEKAVDLLRRASTASPNGAFAYRLECQALTELGRRDEAIRACQRAISNVGSGMDLRALVGAIVSVPPTPTELANAFGFAKRARDVMSQEPWGYAAQCDIARRLGDREMLSQTLEDLRRVAPDHDETRRCEATLAAKRHPWRFGLGWGAIAMIVIGTIAHALRSALRASRAAAVAPLALSVTLAFSATARAEAPEPRPPVAGSLSQWAINDEDPVASVPTHAQRDANPLEYGYFIMDLSDRADRALQRGDHASAVKYWLAVAKAVPDKSVGYTKACESYEALGAWEQAVGACKAALQRDGVLVKDYARFVTLVLQKKTPLEMAEIQDLDKLLDRLRRMEEGRKVVDELNCDIGVRIGSAERLETCTHALAESAPEHPRTIYFQWSLALIQKRYDDARQLIERAKAAGTSPERLQQMEKATTAASSVWHRMKRRWPLAAFGALVFAAGLALAVRAVRAHGTVMSRA